MFRRALQQWSAFFLSLRRNKLFKGFRVEFAETHILLLTRLRQAQADNTVFNTRLALELKIPGYSWYDGEKRNLLCLNLQSSIKRVAGLIKIYEVRILPAVGIVYTKYPFTFPFTFFVFLWCKYGG